MISYALPRRRTLSGAFPARLAVVAMLALPAALALNRAPGLVGTSNRPVMTAAAASQALAGVPIAFEPNVGQSDSRVRYLAHFSSGAAFLTATGATIEYATRSGRSGAAHAPNTGRAVLAMTLTGANPRAAISALGRQGSATNYLPGADRHAWRTGIANYSQVLYAGIYPGIDLRYHGTQSGLEYDFMLAPGANPASIQMRLAGPRSLSLDGAGNLILRFGSGGVVERAPRLYQQTPQGQVTVAGGFTLRGDTVGFRVGAYNHALPLVIDPVLTYSTFLGGSKDNPAACTNAGLCSANDVAYGVATDSSGNIYVTGQTFSTDFPTTTGVLQPTPVSAFDFAWAAFVSKITPANTGKSDLIYSTYYGGSGNTNANTYWFGGEIGYGIAVDAAGDAYIAGQTYSNDIPGASTSPIQNVNNGFANGNPNAFVAELNPTATNVVFATYLGGSGSVLPPGNGDTAYAIALDSANNVYVAGQAYSTDFPVTPGAYRTTKPSGVLVSTAFAAKIAAGGAALPYATFLGGSANDLARGIAVDAAGNAYLTGQTASTNFPVTPGALQATNHAAASGNSNAFVTKLNSTGTGLVYSTYLGGSAASGSGDQGFAIALDSLNDAYVAGQTSSADFPTTPGAYQTVNKDAAAGGTNAFVSKLNPAGASLVYSTFLGGSDPSSNGDGAYGIAVDGSGAAVVAGATSSADFPGTLTTGVAPVVTTVAAPLARSAGAAPGSPRPRVIKPRAILAFTSDAFVTKLNNKGTGLVWSEILTGAEALPDGANAVALDTAGNVDVAGVTFSPDFPTSSDPFQAVLHGSSDAFVAQFGAAFCTVTAALAGGGSGSLGVAYNVGAPTNPHNIEYITFRGPGGSFTARKLLTATCAFGKIAPSTVTLTGVVSTGAGLFHAGDIVTVVLNVVPPGGVISATLTVTRFAATIYGPVTITGGFGSYELGGTF